MTLKRRLQVLAVVTTGGSSVVVSCLRLIIIHRFTITDDILWEMGNICTVSAAEMEVAIIAANMPGISAFYKAWRGGTLSGSSHTASGGHPSQGFTGGGGKNGGASGSNNSHPLVTFSQKRSRPPPLNDDELLLTRHEDETASNRYNNSTTKSSDLSRRTDSEEELTLKSGGKSNIVVNYDVVITEERQGPGDAGARDPFPWDEENNTHQRR